MRLLNVTDAAAAYPAYMSHLRTRVQGFTSLPYARQHAVIDEDHFVWGMPYHQAMGPLGYEVWNVDHGIDSLQHAWALEAGLDPSRMSRDDIVLAQARRFRPDVIVYDPARPALLEQLRRDVPSIRLVLGWVGSALTVGRTWGMIDVMLSCAPESVDRLRTMGINARHVNHSFDPQVLAAIGTADPTIPISFMGSIVRRGEFHLTRERMLLQMCERVPMRIYSPSASTRPLDYAKAAAAGLAWAGITGLRRAGLLGPAKRSRFVRRAERIASPPRRPVHPRLARRMLPGVYGLDYFRALQRSSISLNIHADTSATHASNIRLYESTGVGSCLLTDWRPNLHELYTPDTEVAAYRSVDEAIEKASWLLEHPMERAAMAEAGMRRTLREHTFAHRAQLIDEIIHESLR